VNVTVPFVKVDQGVLHPKETAPRVPVAVRLSTSEAVGVWMSPLYVPCTLRLTLENRHLVVVVPQSVAVLLLLVAFQIWRFNVSAAALSVAEVVEEPVTVPTVLAVRVRTAMYQLRP
jgi:hypothetical protein